MSLSTGTKLGRYEIRSQIGAGGMGEVYLAQDTELDRMVAIKILPEALASDPQRLQRFVQEAKAASALNHPHILTIHEIGTTANSRFIATEFIDGETLRQHVNAGMKLSDILETAIQICGALSAAHSAGIIHRDIKPENIMVRRDGYIKVLDFGLAKLTEPRGSTTDTEAPTKAMVNTGAGTVMGTANYMSPEQAKGTHVDARTDLWSLGAVLYEMITGRVPFHGETPTETVSLILQKEAAPLTRFTNEVPAELERIVTKALTKDREERYQTAKDLLIDLRNLKRKIEVDAEIERTVAPELRPSVSTGGGQSVTPTGSGGVAATTSAKTAHSASSAEYIVSGIKQHKVAVAVIAGLVLIAVGAGVIGMSAYLRARNSEVAIESIAVLPFVNQNHDPDSEYLSDGVTESIINSLTQLPSLKVMARSSVFRYKGKEADPMAAGKELGVRAVLTGRIMQRGDSLTISTELLDVRDNKQLWGEQYQRKVSDLLAVERDIAREITGNLRLKLSGPEQSRVVKHYTENPEAYQLYLKGRFYWNRRTEEGARKGIEYFQLAIDKDPTYALAYTGLADCYSILGTSYNVASLSPSEAIPKAKSAATKALEMDDTLAEAHTSLAYIRLNYDWDWAGAEREFKRAIELDPNYANAHHWYSHYLMAMSRPEESLAESKRALELDQLDLVMNIHLGWHYIYAHQYDLAIAQFRKTLEMDPNYGLTHWYLGQAYALKGMYAEAETELLKAKYLLQQNVAVEADIGYAYAASGKGGEAKKVIDELKQSSKQRYISSYYLALIYTGLGEKDSAFEWLENAYRERSDLLIYLKVDSRLDSLRSDARFAELVWRVRLP